MWIATPTPITYAFPPTLTPSAERVALSQLVGFTNARIETLESYQADLSCMTEIVVGNNRYVALLVGEYSEYMGEIVLVYRLEDDQAILLLDTQERVPGGYSWVLEMEEWQDLDGDERPELAIYHSYTGTAAISERQVHIWQITQNGELSELTAPLYEDYGLVPQRLVRDLNGDGILEAYVADHRGEWYGGGTESFKIYALQGRQVYDISYQFIEWYDERISQVREFITSSYNDALNVYAAESALTEAFRLLLDYENSGRRDEGWQVYWNLTDPANWPHIDSTIVEFINCAREYHRAQFDSGEPFDWYSWGGCMRDE